VIGTVGGFVFNWLKMPPLDAGRCVFSHHRGLRRLRIGMRVRLRQGMISSMGVLLVRASHPTWCINSANGA